MRIRWYGQSAFVLDGSRRVLIDPLGDTSQLAASGLRLDYPRLSGFEADVLLITHEHSDHNGASSVAGSPVVVRSTAGTFPSPIGDIVAVASEHDPEAGTMRGPNTIFRFSLDGVTVCHLGDFGQSALRPEQQRALGRIDVLFVPVGGGFTVDGRAAAALVALLNPRLVVPMHYRTPALNFLEPPDEFLNAVDADITKVGASEGEVGALFGYGVRPQVAVFDAPSARSE